MNKTPEEKEIYLNMNYAEYLFIIMEMKIVYEEIQYYLIKSLGENGYKRNYHEFLKPTVLDHINDLMSK